ncbi:glycine--tRNA ligase subunit beta [Kistimonas scapharcae]|uniref:Glycine--tRNA ligase beta subunit n=1 Tax=Kistimonas scapharcae TaxID=1036133 RepID=A0ABP8V474_9GAMM
MATQDFLVELGTEELPPKALKTLGNAFAEGILQRLEKAGLAYGNHQVFAAPRRLALLVRELETAQPDRDVERKGPAVQAAYDAEGNPTKAAEGFSRSCGVTVSDLVTEETDKGAWLVFRSTEKGSATAELLPAMVKASLDELPIPKRMRWGASRVEFVRPVHWLVMLLGNEVVDCKILGLTAGRETRGHRFHHNDVITIENPADYQRLLARNGYVIADFEGRRSTIRQQVEAEARKLSCEAVIDEDLLDEVTALNEWPVALAGRFDDEFLEVPQEALISSMKEHQKYFHAVDSEGNLKPYFITIANIESQDPAQVIAGNEKVIRPRLADAKFFYDNDRKSTLEERRETLKPVVFQSKLGSLYAKTERIARLAAYIASQEGGNSDWARRAGELCKSDLVSDMVQEFPELQGIMGQYYGINDGEPEEVCRALNEQYMPRFAGDELPTGLTGCAVAIADKLDTLTGIFGINQPPSGNKDPFALRRATLGILRIIVEKKLNLDLRSLIAVAIEGYAEQGTELPAGEALNETVLDFMLERFRAWYQDEKIPVEVFLSVKALKPSQPYDFDRRVKAIHNFSRMPEALALAAANKRVSNIMAKAGDLVIPDNVDEALLTEEAEKALASALSAKRDEVQPLLGERKYSTAMERMASLKDTVDNFFDTVLVNAEDQQVRLNRYALLRQLRDQFLHVADISLLQKS